MAARSRPTVRPVDTVVAIPALNEEAGIEAALEALLDQRDLKGRPLDGRFVQIAVLANNCTDATAAIVRRVAAAAPPGSPPIRLREVTLPPDRAHAGAARHAALDWACDLLADHPDGLICSTDADSRVHADWLAQTWAELGRGVEVIAGTVEFDAVEAAALQFPDARRLEARYSALQAELMAAIDPEPHNPWPNHIWAWGASLAVTRRAYRACGGVPAVPLAEDRALVALLRERDCRVRHSLDVRVSTSCRIGGRAPGGLADLIAAYQSDLVFPCDAELQPAKVVAARARCRADLRALIGKVATQERAARLGLTLDQARLALAAPRFGEAWAVVEAFSTRYFIGRLWPADLPTQIEEATRLLDGLRWDGPADRSDRIRAATAGLWSAPAAQPR